MGARLAQLKKRLSALSLVNFNNIPRDSWHSVPPWWFTTWIWN